MWIKTSQCFAEVDPLDGAIYSMPYGTIMNVDAETGQEYIDQGLVEEYTGVGSEYDFATVTFSYTGQGAIPVTAPFIVDGADGSFINAIDSFSEGESEHQVAMYKGEARVFIVMQQGLKPLEVTGDAEIVDSWTVVVHGDCTIIMEMS